MTPTKSHGICACCREPNLYTAVRCRRCDARLVWAYLIDGKDDEYFDTPLIKLYRRLFENKARQKELYVPCRFCDSTINSTAKICPHCRNWQAVAHITRRAGPLVDPDAPEIKRLLEIYREE